MRSIKLAFTALFAVLAFSAMAATTAFAAHPSILTQSGKTLSLTGESIAGTTPTLRGLNTGVLGTITCEKALVTKGELVTKSPEINKVELLFEGKCEQTVGTSKGTCGDITAHANAELGLLLPATNPPTVGVYMAPESGTTFVTVSCTNGNTTVEGSIVGEIPEKVGTTNQYNKQLSSIQIVFESVNKNSDQQKWTSIDLLGTAPMTGDELKVSGFFGGKASQETTATLKGDGTAEICTIGSCP